MSAGAVRAVPAQAQAQLARGGQAAHRGGPRAARRGGAGNGAAGPRLIRREPITLRVLRDIPGAPTPILYLTPDPSIPQCVSICADSSRGAVLSDSMHMRMDSSPCQTRYLKLTGLVCSPAGIPCLQAKPACAVQQNEIRAAPENIPFWCCPQCPAGSWCSQTSCCSSGHWTGCAPTC